MKLGPVDVMQFLGISAALVLIVALWALLVFAVVKVMARWMEKDR